MFRYLITAALMTFALSSYASGHEKDCDPAPKAPIDGGASLLLAGGVAAIVRKVKQRRSAQ